MEIDKPVESLEYLGDFQQTDHYQLSQVAKPIIERMQSLMPIQINWGGITYGYLKEGTKRTVGQISFNRYDYQKPVRIRVSLAFLDPNIKVELQETMTHELAHLGAMRWKTETGHNYYWGYLMIAMGYEPARCVTPQESVKLDRAVKSLSNEPFKFADCPVCQETVLFEYNQGDYKYHCPKCGGTNYIP